MAKSLINMLGGIWFFFVGAPLAAWFISTFFIFPFLVPGGYALNLQTVLMLSNPEPVLVFVGFWLVFSLGYAGGSKLYHRGSR